MAPKTAQGKTSQDGRRGGAAAVGPAAGQAAADAFARAGFADPALVLHWQDIAGAEVARLARPMRLKDGTLTLLAEPAAALFLAHESRALAARINSWAGANAVARVKFVQGRLEGRGASPPPPKPAKAVKPGDPAQHFHGPEALKSALQSLARWRAADQNRDRAAKEQK